MSVRQKLNIAKGIAQGATLHARPLRCMRLRTDAQSRALSLSLSLSLTFLHRHDVVALPTARADHPSRPQARQRSGECIPPRRSRRHALSLII
jgi:hypothetical protein